MPISPTVLNALAQVRHAIRTGSRAQAGLLYYALLSLAADALPGVGDMTVPGSVLVQPSEVSQGGPGFGLAGDRVRDLWITPREAARRLGRSERWLRRRRSKSPYCSFCIAADSGRGFRVSAKGLDEYMERARRASH